MGNKKKRYFTIFGIILFLLFIEIGSRLYKKFHPSLLDMMPPTCFNYYLGYRYVPNANNREQDKHKLGTDRYGFIHNGNCQRAINLDDTTFRIIFLGGSTVAGAGSPSNSTTIPAILESLCKTKFAGKSIQVINAGVSGYMSGQESLYFSMELCEKFKPNLVVTLDGHNDALYALTLPDWHPQETPYHKQITRAFDNNMSVKGIAVQTVSYVFSHFKSLYFLGMVLKHIKKTETFDNIDEGLKYYKSNLLNIYGICKARNIGLILILQPTTIEGKKVYTESERKWIELSRKNLKEKEPDKYQSLLDTFFKNAENIFKSFSSYEGLVWSNFLTIYQEVDKDVYVDTCHYNELGNRIIAENILPLVEPFIIDWLDEKGNFLRQKDTDWHK